MYNFQIVILFVQICFLGASAQEYQLQWKEKKGVIIFGYGTKRLYGISSTECKKACLNETSFNCKSIDYEGKYQLTEDIPPSNSSDYDSSGKKIAEIGWPYGVGYGNRDSFDKKQEQILQLQDKPSTYRRKEFKTIKKNSQLCIMNNQSLTDPGVEQLNLPLTYQNDWTHFEFSNSTNQKVQEPTNLPPILLKENVTCMERNETRIGEARAFQTLLSCSQLCEKTQKCKEFTYGDSGADDNQTCGISVTFEGQCSLYRDGCTYNKTYLAQNLYKPSQQKSISDKVSQFSSKEDLIVLQNAKKKDGTESMTLKFLTYFNFAILKGKQDFKDLGDCYNSCSDWKQKCCASVTMVDSNKKRNFQYFCINNAVVKTTQKLKLADFTVEMKCDNVWAGAMFLKIASASVIATIFMYQ